MTGGRIPAEAPRSRSRASTRGSGPSRSTSRPGHARGPDRSDCRRSPTPPSSQRRPRGAAAAVRRPRPARPGHRADRRQPPRARHPAAAGASRDGLRRADTRFGLVNSQHLVHVHRATNATTPAASRTPASSRSRSCRPRAPGTRRRPYCAAPRSVTASSSGNWLFHLPQYDPVNAFDGNPDTAWAEGSAGNAGRASGCGSASPGPSTSPPRCPLTPLPGTGCGPRRPPCGCETDRGIRGHPAARTARRSAVKAPTGRANWLKVTILGSQTPARRAVRRGLLRDLHPRRPGDPAAAAPHRRRAAPTRPPRSSRCTAAATRAASPRSRPRRGCTASSASAPAGTYDVTARRWPVPGDELDRLLYERRARAAGPDHRDRRLHRPARHRSLSPRNLVDGDLTTAWIAGDRPTIHLRWPGRKTDRRDRAGRGGRSLHPARADHDQLAGRRGDRGRRRERPGPLRPDHHGPPRHHHQPRPHR